MIIVRQATLEDSSALFGWRNDPVTRSMSLSLAEVSWEEHIAWLTATMADARRTLLIGEITSGGGLPVAVGMCRFNLMETAAEVSINLSPQHRGRGLAPLILTESIAMFEKSLTSTLPLSATIRATNRPSIRLFENAGFRLVSADDGVNHYVRPLTTNQG
jgi:RimJ/RimL family protein N-acetyltransferase